MDLKKHLDTRKGAAIELASFCGVALSTGPMFIVAPLLYGIAIGSIIGRNTEWSGIGLYFNDFSSKKIRIGIGMAFLYHCWILI